METPQNGTSFQHQQQMAIEVDVQAEPTALTAAAAAEEDATQNLVSFFVEIFPKFNIFGSFSFLLFC